MSPYTLVSRGLIRGAKCLISDVEFIAHDPTKEELSALVDQAIKHSAEIVTAQDADRNPSRRPLTLEERRVRYQSQ